jgi:hypothetical protein
MIDQNSLSRNLEQSREKSIDRDPIQEKMKSLPTKRKVLLSLGSSRTEVDSKLRR